MSCYSKVIKEAWNPKKTTCRNLRDMGLATDPNKAISIPSFKQEKLQKALQIVNKIESDSEEETEIVQKPAPKRRVAEKLEQEAKAPRERRFM